MIWLLASPCILWLLLLFIMGVSKAWPDLKARHRRALSVVREIELQEQEREMKRQEQEPEA